MACEDVKGVSGEASRAWVSLPRKGKHISFDGRYLHAAPADLARTCPSFASSLSSSPSFSSSASAGGVAAGSSSAASPRCVFCCRRTKTSSVIMPHKFSYDVAAFTYENLLVSNGCGTAATTTHLTVLPVKDCLLASETMKVCIQQTGIFSRYDYFHA